VVEISTPWQHCLAGHRVIIGKPMKLEKMDTSKSKIGAAKSKRNPQIHFAPRQANSQFRLALSHETPAKHTYVKFYI
jgi:hypothetical protein